LTNDYQVIVVGGGPAGCSALLWCHSTGLRAVLLERERELGGQLLEMFHPTDDYPGLPARTGRELRDYFEAHLRGLELEWRVGCRVTEVSVRERRVVCDGEELTAPANRRARKNLPGAA
jgi:thioredoxin reductase (NADPH)